MRVVVQKTERDDQIKILNISLNGIEKGDNLDNLLSKVKQAYEETFNLS